MSFLVAGGGPAGAAAAAILARAGRRVTVLERASGPADKICGEFLSGEAVASLGQIGIDARRLGGHAIGAVRLVRGNRVARAALPFTAMGLSRRVLDEALLTHAASCGAEVRRGQAIARISETTLTLANGEAATGEQLFLATGKHDLRGARREAAAEDLVGFKMHFALASAPLAELSGHVEVLIFSDAYVGLQRIEDERANLCLLVRRRFLEDAGGDFASLLDRLQRDNVHLRARLRGAAPLFARPLSIFRVPYGFVHTPTAGDPKQVFRLGDQAAVIPSFTGDGMAIALHSAALAARMALAGADAHAYHRHLRRDVVVQIRRAWLLYRLGAWGLGQAGLMGLARVWPNSLRHAAALTRVPAPAVARVSATASKAPSMSPGRPPIAGPASRA